MTLLRQLAIAALPGGIIALAAYRLLCCHHRHEIWRRRRTPMGEANRDLTPMGLECAQCGRWRAVDLAGPGMGRKMTAPGVRREREQMERMWRELETAERSQAAAIEKALDAAAGGRVQ